MKTRELTDENFSRLVTTEGGAALVEFGAEWCPPCKAMNPVLDELSAYYDDKAIIAKVNVDDNPAITTQYGVRNLPTFLFFKDGEVIDRIIGAVPKSVLTKNVDTLLSKGNL